MKNPYVIYCATFENAGVSGKNGFCIDYSILTLINLWLGYMEAVNGLLYISYSKIAHLTQFSDFFVFSFSNKVGSMFVAEEKKIEAVKWVKFKIISCINKQSGRLLKTLCICRIKALVP